jgi:hypothetical protein
MENITLEQYKSVSLHVGIVDIVPQFRATIKYMTYGTTKVAY